VNEKKSKEGVEESGRGVSSSPTVTTPSNQMGRRKSVGEGFANKRDDCFS